MAIFNTAILPYFSCGLPTTIPEASYVLTEVENGNPSFAPVRRDKESVTSYHIPASPVRANVEKTNVWSSICFLKPKRVEIPPRISALTFSHISRP